MALSVAPQWREPIVNSPTGHVVDRLLEAAARREAVADTQVQASNELVSVYRAQFQIGRRNLLDLLNAYSELSNAELAREAAKIDRSLARYQLEYAAGRLYAVFEAGSR